MPFVFEITNATILSKAGVVVLDGRLLSGILTTDSPGKLVQGGQHFPVLVKGVLMGLACSEADDLSISVELNYDAVTAATIGARIIG